MSDRISFRIVGIFPFSRIASRYVIFTLVTALLVIANQTANAFTVADRDAAWSAWTNTYYYVANDGRAYIRLKEGDNTPVSFWQFAEQIEMVEDASCYPDVQTNMVNLMWACILSKRTKFGTHGDTLAACLRFL